MQTPRKILGFDSWTGGSFNFARLVPALAERNMTLTILHIGSWGSDPGRASKEMIGDLEFRDVSFYPGKSFDEILDIERPDAVLFLSTQTYAHRAFQRYCRQRGIPTLHLYHGIANVQVTNDTVGSHKIGLRSYARYALPKVGKLLRRTFPCYARALLKTGARPHEWWRFLADVIRQTRARPALRAADDARTTKVAVYTNADVEHAVRIYGFAKKDVVAVGNPDLLRFGFTDSFGVQNRQTFDLEYVMYVDTALAIVGLLFKSEDSFIEHLVQTARSVQALGKRFAFKPHPAHDPAFLARGLDGTGIEIVSNSEFVPRLSQCCACISEATSVALIPALTGMPLLFAQYGELREQRFGPALTSYPRGYALEDIEDVANTLRADAERFDRKAVAEWIQFNAGPVPAEDMPRRVAGIVESMIAGGSAPRMLG
jgi:peptidoglycan/xylan/chitin deacetylase (PgdA/CDA1 family)